MTLEEEKNTSPIPSRSYNPEREKPMIHPCVDPPACESCQKLELSFFDPECPGCRSILENPNTTVPEIFSVLRQWTPQTQQNLDLLIDEVKRRLLILIWRHCHSVKFHLTCPKGFCLNHLKLSINFFFWIIAEINVPLCMNLSLSKTEFNNTCICQMGCSSKHLKV